MDRLSSLIAGTLQRKGLTEPALAALAVHRANEWIAGQFKNLKEFPKAEKIVDGVLHINCPNSMIVQEMQSQKVELNGFLTRECPFVKIQDIRFVRAG